MAGGDQGQGDDRHRLLCVIGAVTERDEAAAEDLGGAEVLVGPRRVQVAEDMENADQEGVAKKKADNRRRDQSDHHRNDCSPFEFVNAVPGDAHADEGADEGM